MSFHRSAFVFLLAGMSVHAQTADVRPPSSQRKDAPPLGAPNVPLGQTLITEDIIEHKLNGAELAALYTRYTGRRVIPHSAAMNAEFTFVQEASPDNPLTFAQAAELLRKAAVLEGFVFTQHPDDPNLDVLTAATGGPKPTNINVDVYNETSTLPDKDVVVTYVMTLSYIKPDQAVAVFNQIIGQVGSYGSISAVPNASAVVITEKASLIRKLVDLKGVIDVPGSVQATRFIQVQYADVNEVANVLNSLVGTNSSNQSTASPQRPATAGGDAAASLPGATTAGETTPIQIIGDARTNRIFAMGRPVDLVFIENLVHEFDIPSSEKTFFRRKLRFLKVADFLSVAGDALTRAFSGTGEAVGGSNAGSGNPSNNSHNGQGGNSRQSNGNATGSFSSRNSRNNSGNSGLGNNSSATSSGVGGSMSLRDPDADSAPESMLVGRTQLVADNITNSIVVQGPPSALEVVSRLIDQLDVKPEQVMISSVIGQLSLNHEKELGMNYLVNGKDVMGGGGGDGFAVIPPLTPSTFPAFDPGSLAASGLRVYGKVGDMNAYIRALASKTDFTVLSRPSIFTSNNQKGVIASGEEIAVPTEGGTSSSAYSSGTRIQYKPVELVLEVIPLVNSNNEITMQISLKSDERNGNQTIQGAGTNGGDLTVPNIATRQIQTTATVPNNQTIVLGGLIVNRDSKEKSGIPLLSDIPYVGALFGSRKDGKSRSELMVFIQPSVISNGESLKATQNDMHGRYRVAGGAEQFAGSEGELFDLPDPVATPAPAKSAGKGDEKPTSNKSPLGTGRGPVHHQ